MKRLLLCIDFQMDFIGGLMTVKNGRLAADYTCNFLRRGEINKVLITGDWHPITHCSFERNGGQWNTHCVQHTVGASIYNKLLKTIWRLECPYEIVLKGQDPTLEEYSFLRLYNNPEDPELYKVYLDWINRLNEYDEIEVTGIAGDYCVLETLKDLKPLWGKITVLSNCVASIDGGATLFKFCKPNGIRIMEYKKRYEELGIFIPTRQMKKEMKKRR